MYIRGLVDYTIRLSREALHGHEHIDDAEGQRDCTHGAKPGVSQLAAKRLWRRKRLD
jgi:hypothetical protein